MKNSKNSKFEKKFIDQTNCELSNFKKKLLTKMEKYSKKGFWIQGSSILWILFSDFKRLPNDIDLILPNDNFDNFDEKYAYFRKKVNFNPNQKYDYFNWIENEISVDVFLNYAPTVSSRRQKIFKFNQKEYKINFLSLETAYFSKISLILWKSNQIKKESNINMDIKKTTIEDIEFIYEKININEVDLEKMVKDEIKHSFCTNLQNLYKDIENLKIEKVLNFFNNELIIENIKTMHKLFIKHKDYLPKINWNLIFDWKKPIRKKKI